MEVNQIRIGFRLDERGPAHSQVSIFVGKQKGQRGHAGAVTMRNSEWDELQETLRTGMLQGAHRPYASLADVFDLLEDRMENPWPGTEELEGEPR